MMIDQTSAAYAAILAATLSVLPGAPVAAGGFTTPSNNITCYLDVFSPDRIDEVDVICLIFGASWDLPPDFGDKNPTCDLDQTRTVILPPEGPASARWTCHGDVFWPLPLGALSYGSGWSLMGYSCDVDTDGVRCTNASGNRFHVRRAALALD